MKRRITIPRSCRHGRDGRATSRSSKSRADEGEMHRGGAGRRRSITSASSRYPNGAVRLTCRDQPTEMAKARRVHRRRDEILCAAPGRCILGRSEGFSADDQAEYALRGPQFLSPRAREGADASARCALCGLILVRRRRRHGDIHRCRARPGLRDLRISTGPKPIMPCDPGHHVEVERPSRTKSAVRLVPQES